MTKLIEIKRYRKPYKGAEVRFTRTDGKHTFVIYAAKCYESWEQWGPAPYEVICDNVPSVERWRHPGK